MKERIEIGKRIEIIVKMVNEFRLTVVHFAGPNPMLVDLPLDKKLWKIRTWPPGRRGVLDKHLTYCTPHEYVDSTTVILAW